MRLSRRSGTWILEFTRLVAVDEHLMRPELRRVAATSDALRSLAQTYPPERIREAEALMGQDDDGSERVFELAEDGWAPAALVRHSQRPLARSEANALVAELQAQVLGLRALYDALLMRVIVLEASARAPRASEPETLSVRRVPSRRDVLTSLKYGGDTPESVNPRERSEAHAAPPPPTKTATPVAPAPPPSAPSGPATLESAEAPAPGPRLALPSPSDVVGCLQMLAADVEMKPENAGIPAELGTHRWAVLRDESKEVLGVILVDERAGAELGGALLGLPKATRDVQAERGLEQDTLEALNEICNNLGGLVNRANPKLYTRLGALERVSGEVPTWLAKPGKKLGLSTAAGGRLWLATR